MDDNNNARTLGKRDILASLDREFSRLYANACAVIEQTSVDILYAVPEPGGITSVSPQLPSIGESVLRGAAAIEQTFGGITANLWDDPFEWTLPETLSSAELVNEYLSEVDAARQRAFRSIASDDDLRRRISGPWDEPRALFTVLLETLVKASDYHGRAVATLKMFFQ